LGKNNAGHMNYEESTEETQFTPETEATLRQIVLDRAPAELEQLAVAVGDNEAFVHLPSAAAAAFHLGQFSNAKQFAERALVLAPAFEKNWNYGNAIHLGHTVIGLLALNEQDYTAAINELHASGQTPGSPQLNSFGPTMHLAKELLKLGHVEPALAYLHQCRVFWEMGGTWLDLWERKIRAGLVPNFFQHSHV
jgi:tetratricopeptide (TPR) repeat protein